MWSYDPTQLPVKGTTPTQAQLKNAVRRMLGDVIPTDQQLQDEEIIFALGQWPSFWRAAADCARSLAAQLARFPDVVTGELKTNYSERAKQYLRQAGQWDNMAVARGGALAYAGGISLADKIRQEENTDRVAPAYNRGMQENYIPVGPVGNESGTRTNSIESGT